MEENKLPNEDDITNENLKSFRVPEEKSNNFAFLKNILLVFCATLVIGIIFISTVLKSASPTVDLDIGEEPVASMDQRGDEDYDNIRMQIDERLKMIQNEEEMPGVSNNDYESDEEIIKRLRSDESSKSDKTAKKQDVIKNEEVSLDIEPLSIPAADAPKVNYLSKIYIGQFSDMDKAVEMQSNILNSGADVNTVIKEVNGYYTIQAGVFTNYESAKAVADKLNNAGFSAKIVKEIR